MKKSVFLAVLIQVILFPHSAAATTRDSINIPSFGKVYIYNRTTTPRNVVIMISGNEGWRQRMIDFSLTFSDMNSLVLGVDLQEYYKRLKQRSEDCSNISADFVQLATDLEKKFDFPDYLPPLLMGYSTGATFVYGILAQAREGTFLGGISLGFCPEIDFPVRLCETNGLAMKTVVAGKKYLFLPDEKLGNPWIVLYGNLDKSCTSGDAAGFISKTKGAELIALPNVGHGFSKWSDFMPQWQDAYNRLITKYEKERPPVVNVDEVKDLPLIITNSKVSDRQAPLALLISGDGGWYGFEQQIADNLAQNGIPTIGLDSKKYFWHRKTPEQTASDIAKALNYYGKEWGRTRYVLVGYSLGAEIVPFIANRLPEDVKSKVQSTALLSPATTTDFEIHITNMLGMGNKQNTYNTTEEIIKMQNIPTLLIFGEGEKNDLPGLLGGTKAIIRKIPGDHHYKFNLPLIMQTMKENKIF
jgi:type IV secretory pathway VirJ component